MMREFPKVFGFEHCGVLFSDQVTQNLFRFNVTKGKEGGKDEVTVATFPSNIGCTGVCIENNKIVYFNSD